MTTTETNIANKYLSEIEAAETTGRAAIVAELSGFLGVVEKRINLTKLETAAESAVGKVEGAFSSAVEAVERYV